MVWDSTFSSTAAAKAAKTKGLKISTTQSNASGWLSYTGFKNGDDKGKRIGIVLGYDTDLTEKLTLKLHLPYSKVDVDDSVNTSSHVLMPSVALSYRVSETDDVCITTCKDTPEECFHPNLFICQEVIGKNYEV